MSISDWSSDVCSSDLNLRGLGIKRTLVLLNGRRLVAGGTGANSSPDLNMIPVVALARTDVLKDGASAIYGADAMAGRSEERRVGKECVSPCRSRWSPDH